MDLKARHEIEHGVKLALDDAERTWGWGTPAGRIRAQRRARIIASGARLGPGTRALEIGCGTGMFTELFAQTGASLLAVDISPDLLKIAMGRNLPAEQVQFCERRFEDCDIEGPFDAVVGSSVLHHLDLEEALRKICGLLKPGGTMSFAEPNMLNPQVFVERRFRKWFPEVSDDETAFVRWKLRRQLEAAGFKQIRVTPFDWLHPATPASLIRLIGGLGRCLEKTPAIREFAGSMAICALRPE